MPSFDFVKESALSDSFRVKKIIGQFDLQMDVIREHFAGNIDIEGREWNVGIIVGPSGSGKTTIARELFGEFHSYQFNAPCVLEDMPESLSVDEITRMFTTVGFASVPSWLKPYGVLSNGEKMRVELARALLEDKEIIVFDEFTSVVDRQVAQVASHCVQKAVRAQNRQFIAVTCHYDVLEWLEPDWVYDCARREFFFTHQASGLSDRPSRSRFGRSKIITGKRLASITI